MKREPNTIYVLACSFGKDSLATLFAIKELGYPLDLVVSASVWATENIPADYPPMYAFKQNAAEKIKELFGVDTLFIASTSRERERHSSIYSTEYENVKSKALTEYMDFLYCEDNGVHLISKPTVSNPLSYEEMFYHTPKVRQDKQFENQIVGFPMTRGAWCNSRLKVRVQENFGKAPWHKVQI